MKTIIYILEKGYAVKIIILCLAILISCERLEPERKQLPASPEEIEKSVKITQFIAKESSTIINAAIDNAVAQSTLINPNKIAENIKLIDGVISAVPMLDGEGIIIEQEDGIVINAMIVSSNDERLFNITSLKSLDDSDISSNYNYYFPTGEGKVLILAPFQYEIKSPLDKLYRRLSTAGYHVDTCSNGRATVEYFRGDTLSKYDIVIIFSHAGGDGQLLFSDNQSQIIHSSIVATGTIYNEACYTLLPVDQLETLSLFSLGPEGDIPYLAITVPWLYKTSKNEFPNTWVFIGGCNTAKYLSGSRSLSAALLDLGAGGYNGFNAYVINYIINPVAVKMTSEFLSGRSFQEASDKVRNDPILNASFKVWLINLLDDSNIYNLNSFIDIQKRTEDYYLFDTDYSPELTLVSSVVEVSTPTILELEFNLLLGNVIPPVSAFSVLVNSTSKAVSSVSISESKVMLTLTNPVFQGDIVTISYTKPATNPLQTLSGGQAVSFSVQPVTNNVTTPSSGIIFNPNLTYGSVPDIDGNVYKTIQIGTQTWMAENLKTIKYNDGTAIPLVTDGATGISSSNPSYCWYNNDISNKSLYGALYNWYAVNTSKLCPTGWNVPTDAEWTILIDYLGGWSIASGKLKETGTLHWKSPNTGATNESGFSALPGGYRIGDGYGGMYSGIGDEGFWWLATEISATSARSRNLSYNYNSVTNIGNFKQTGYSIRCVKGSSGESKTIVIQPGPEGLDASVEYDRFANGSEFFYNDGNDSLLYVYLNHQGETVWDIESYIKFPLAQISSHSTIISAKLYVYGYASINIQHETPTITLSKLIGPWDELTVKWDIKPEKETISNINFNNYDSWHEWEVTSIVQAWINGESNFGFGITASKNLIMGEIYSGDNSDSDKRPNLIVSYSNK